MKAAVGVTKRAGKSRGDDGCNVPGNCVDLRVAQRGAVGQCGDAIGASKPPPRKAHLDGNLARRALGVVARDYVIWDTQLTGFGLRIRTSGTRVWIVRLRQRGRLRMVTIGRVGDVEAAAARSEARRMLAEVALDGLPTPERVKAAPLFADYVDEFWSDYAHYWKPQTRKRSRSLLVNHLIPHFGDLRLDAIERAEVVRWRDACADVHEASFNRGVPVLAAMFKYASQLGYVRKGTNPCLGLPRFKTEPMERYLTLAEYRRLGAALAREAARYPAHVAIIRLLLFTGARSSEITALEWAWVKPPRLVLPDSKTGPRVIWLNAQAQAVIAQIKSNDDGRYVFASLGGLTSLNPSYWWLKFRKRCALPDLRIHDLRHSFASIAIMDNVPLATVGKLLGHVLPETTAKYAHLSDDSIVDAAQRVSGRLAAALGLKL
jgi:integrase